MELQWEDDRLLKPMPSFKCIVYVEKSGFEPRVLCQKLSLYAIRYVVKETRPCMAHAYRVSGSYRETDSPKRKPIDPDSLIAISLDSLGRHLAILFDMDMVICLKNPDFIRRKLDSKSLDQGELMLDFSTLSLGLFFGFAEFLRAHILLQCNIVKRHLQGNSGRKTASSGTVRSLQRSVKLGRNRRRNDNQVKGQKDRTIR